MTYTRTRRRFGAGIALLVGAGLALSGCTALQNGPQGIIDGVRGLTEQMSGFDLSTLTELGSTLCPLIESGEIEALGEGRLRDIITAALERTGASAELSSADLTTFLDNAKQQLCT